MSPADSSALGLWQSLALLGIGLVIVGVVLEGPEILMRIGWWPKNQMANVTQPSERVIPKWADALGAIGWFILVVGLALEMWGHIRVEEITNRENRRLSEELAKSIKLAADANAIAASANERAASNDLARVKLQNEINQRFLPRTQKFLEGRVAFLEALKGKPKLKMELLYQTADTESFSFAQQISLALNTAGWTVIGIRPVRTDDIPPNSGLKLPLDAPLAVRAGGGYGGWGLILKRFPDRVGWLGEPDNAPGAFFLAMGASGVGVAGMGSEDPRLPDQLLRVVIAPRVWW